MATTAAGQAGPSNECSYPVDAEELVDYLGYCDTAPAGSSWYIALRSVKFLCPGWEAEWNVVHEDALGNRAIYHAPRSATVTYTLAPLHGELRWFEQPTGPGTHYLESYPPCAFDYDGDGDPELVLAASRLILCSTSTAAVLTHADGRVVQYAPAKGLGVDGLVDVDGDGRPDLLTAVGFDVNCETEPLHGDCARLHWPLPLHARADGSFAVDETIWPLLRERCAAARSRPSLLARAKDGNVDEEATADGVLCALLWGTEPAAIEQQLERECGMAMRHACDTETPNACPRWLRDLASVPLPVAGSFCRVGGGVESCPAEPAPRPGPPGPASTAVAMVHIPGGSFLMGSSHVKPKEVAAHRVTVDGFEIDKTEVTVAEYARCVNAGKCSKPATDTSCDPRPSWPLRGTMEICLEGAVSTECNWGHAGREDHPVNCVDWNEASVYCRWVGKRLPTEQEWEYAARGSDGRTYPWGNAKRRSQTCSSRSGTCPVGSHASDASPFGVLDMAANVMEWTSSPYCDFPSPIPGDPCSDWAVVRGGDVVSLEPSAVRGMQSPRTRSWIIGFRCVR